MGSFSGRIDMPGSSETRSALTRELTRLKEAGEAEVHARICSGELDWIVPGLQVTSGCSQGTKKHLEGDVALHTAKVFSNLIRIASEDPEATIDEMDLLAVLLHDVDKPGTREEDAEGDVHFPGHEEKAADRVPETAARLKLTPEQTEKLNFLVREHGKSHMFPRLAPEEQRRLATSPYWRNLRLLQKADAISWYLTSDSSTHGEVFWDEFERARSV